jgi:hypothetical protein
MGHAYSLNTLEAMSAMGMAHGERCGQKSNDMPSVRLHQVLLHVLQGPCTSRVEARAERKGRWGNGPFGKGTIGQIQKGLIPVPRGVRGLASVGVRPDNCSVMVAKVLTCRASEDLTHGAFGLNKSASGNHSMALLHTSSSTRQCRRLLARRQDSRGSSRFLRRCRRAS